MTDPGDDGASAGSEPAAPVDGDVRAALCDLKSMYFFYVETRQWKKLRGLYTDDAQLVGYMFGLDGPDSFVEGLAEFAPGTCAVHYGFMPQFRRRSESVVRARWTVHDYVTWPLGSRTIPGATREVWGRRGYGYYEDEYRQTSSGWKICYTRLARLRVEFLHGEPPDEMDEIPPPDLRWLT